MKSLLLSCGLASALIFSASTALAGHQRHQDQHHYDDNARVIHVKSIYSNNRYATPYRDCGYTKQYRDNRYNDYSSAVLGGLAGGSIGNQFGKGSGKTVMAVAGTVIGGAIGYQLGYDTDYNDYKKSYKKRGKHCKTNYRYHDKKKFDGYLVKYRYQGRTYTTRMYHRPGKYIPVNVSVRPIGRFY